MKNLYKHKIGQWGETVAADYLAAQGCSILSKNVRTREGEIDLVVELEGDTRFVEVKTRTSHRFGYPEEAITLNKYEHMTAAAESYINSAGYAISDWHLDVVAVYGKPGLAEMEIEWFKDVEVN